MNYEWIWSFWELLGWGEWELGGTGIYGEGIYGVWRGNRGGLRDCSGNSLNFPRRVAHAYVTKKESGFPCEHGIRFLSLSRSHLVITTILK